MKRKQSKTQVQRNFNIVLIFLSFLFLSMIVRQFLTLEEENLEMIPFLSNHLSADVKNYTPVLEEELKQLGLEQYTYVLAAIMQQESRGSGGDPMQASESAGLAPNSINDPHLSIKQGVKHFERTLVYGNQKGVDFPTVIQAYNMGIGYIDFVADNGGSHSEELAKNFSYLQVQKNPSIYNCGGDQSNFRYPYCYGDFTYYRKVAENLDSLDTNNSDA